MYWSVVGKSSKKIVSIFAVCLAMAMGSAWAEASPDRITVPLSDPGRPGLVKASLLAGSITVKGYDGKDVIVEARVRASEGSERAGGMRRIPMTSTGLSVEEDSNTVNISTESMNRAVDVTIQVPRKTSLYLRTVNDGDIVVNGVEGEMDVNDVNGEVTMTDISGNAVAHALNGKVLVTFARIDPSKPMAFSSLNGDIDVTFPADLKANVSLSSDQGDVYSEFDIQLQATAPKQITEDGRKSGGKYRVKIDKTLRGTINGGGPEYQFKNFNGDIYIRKAGAR